MKAMHISELFMDDNGMTKWENIQSRCTFYYKSALRRKQCV